MPFIIKPNANLSNGEVAEIQAHLLSYWKGNDHEYVLRKRQLEPTLDSVLHKVDGKIIGSLMMARHELDNPFFDNRLVVTFSLAVKQKGYKGNLIWKLGPIWAKRHFGRFWFLKSVVGASTIGSPRVYESFCQLFPEVYPSLGAIERPEVIEFQKRYMREVRGQAFAFDAHGVVVNLNYQDIDVTDDWDRVFKAKNPKVNDFFFETGIFERRGDRIIRTDRELVCCGVRSLKHVFGYKTRPETLEMPEVPSVTL
ncbi:hypothetical protein [Pontibacter sp. G13]|uniref:hypothetical protein n=1 Tax=Pontibacter sp. G13 TaxID=3074898 RepID=UPI00288BAB74|nr:hypothetical protein [Pontibacter sp. G13]WNJ18689.1 hypothetical protein RJD25_27860 [Pontibacter sp. G13]